LRSPDDFVSVTEAARIVVAKPSTNASPATTPHRVRIHGSGHVPFIIRFAPPDGSSAGGDLAT
jgi:hypothetical protein